MRRIDVECRECGRREELILESDAGIPPCDFAVPSDDSDEPACLEACGGRREIVWGSGGPGFRVKGGESRF